ncbi:MAG: hypothetical protein ACFE9Q_12170 [Candidatus Hodarchaeota archaeon]
MIILTGFGPYGKFKSNLSGDIAKEFSFKIQNFQLKKEIIPVSWMQSINLYKDLLINLNCKPDLVVLLGIHSSKNYHLERYGWNFNMGKDIEKKVKFGLIKVCPHLWIRTTINLLKIFSVIKDKSYFSISNYAGSYLCNYLYYWALYISNKDYPVIFIHIPSNGNIIESSKKIEIILEAILKTHLKEDL